MRISLKWICWVLVAATAVAQQPQREARDVDVATRANGLKRVDGFAPYYWDAKKGELLFELSPAALEREFLYFTALGSGVGSLDMFADRSSTHGAMVCRLMRVGPRVLVIQENTQFRAEAGPAALRQSVEASFPTSVLASLPIEAETNGTLLVNANPLIVRDVFDLLGQLRNPQRAINGNIVRTQGGGGPSWRLDNERSVVDLEHTKDFPMNTEVEAMLTFTSDQGQRDINAPDPHALTVREHHSFVALPAPGFEPRERDFRVGYFGPEFDDFSQPYDKPLERGFIARWRLQKKDPNAAVSEPVKPITFYLDPGMPPEIKQAAKRGILWWNDAFLAAGFKNAIVVEDLPGDADPLDIRYPTIQWTNRAGRGWSVGMEQGDPRTGEILHSVVQLDSHRWRTAANYWDALVGQPVGQPPSAGTEQALDMFAALDNADPNISEKQVMLNRLALLACHEVGHVLGLGHNFIASTFGRGSVMDYYAPLVKFHPDGSPDLSDAYMQGVGSYDKMAIEWGYSEGKSPASAVNAAGNPVPAEKARLNAIVRKWNDKGVIWGPSDDPRWNAYDDGPDPVTWLKEVLPVRDKLLARYSTQLLANGQPWEELSSRFALVYLFHRYALAAAVNVVGGAKIPPSVKGDGLKPVEIWPAASQKEALELLTSALRPPQLTQFPPNLWQYLAPPSQRDPEAFRSSAGYVFAEEDGAREISSVVAGGLLDPERLQRADVLHQHDAQSPSAKDIVDALVKTATADSANPVHQAVEADIAERLMILSQNETATLAVRAVALAGVEGIEKSLNPMDSTFKFGLSREIDLFLRDPKNNTPKLKPSGAPPGPPV
ncbi:MAG: zinc-dependent metalloprotease [Terriglobales bacterium]